MRNVEKLKLGSNPPEPPPRNIVLKPIKTNIYRWELTMPHILMPSVFSVSSEKSENMKNNKIREEMKENLDHLESTDDVDGRLMELGARPKTFNTSMTMDIR